MARYLDAAAQALHAPSRYVDGVLSEAMRYRFPLLWLALVAMWLVLNRTLAAADAIVGRARCTGRRARARAAAARAGSLAPASAPSSSSRASWCSTSFDRTLPSRRSYLRPGTRGRVAGFVDIPLDIRHPVALAALACIITATPGTAWAKYDSLANVVTIHVLDLVDGAALVRTIKDRYEAKLKEVFE